MTGGFASPLCFLFAMRLAFWVPLGGLLLSMLGAAASPRPAGPSVRELVEFKRIVQPRDRSADSLREQVSADGTRAFIVTRKAEVATDKNRYEIQLLQVAASRLATGRVPPPEIVLSVAVAHDGDYASPALQKVRWWDDRTLIFLARLNSPTLQVYRLDLATRQLTQLTREAHPIVSYAASADMKRLVYAAQVPNPPLRDGERSVVVGNQSFWSVKFGQHDLRSQNRMYRFYVADLGASPRALGPAFVEGNGAIPQVSISPDGRWALLPRYEPDRTMAWARDYPMVDDLSKRFGLSQRADPLQYFSRPLAYAPRRMLAWAIDEGREQAVVDAPDDALPSGGQDRTDRFWLGNGASVVLVGTHLPLNAAGEGSTASHVIEYWPDSRKWAVVAQLQARAQAAHAVDGGLVVVDGEQRRQFQRLENGSWQEVSDAPPRAEVRRGWTLTVQEGLNLPPDVVATGPEGQKMRLTTLNPQFDASTWGSMQRYSWRDAQGRSWDGGLMLPSGGVDRRVRHPLVIQTYGFSAQRFYLDGPNIGDGMTSGFAGRAFLREGLLVLDMPWRPAKRKVTDPAQALRQFNDGVRGAVDALVKDGLVDPARVGIIGWSATGERVLNLVTFSSLPIRAATIADGDANTLFSLTVTYGANDSMWKRKEQINQGLPYGPGLRQWVRNDPALHTDCVKTALRIETYGPWVLNNWDVYALLRRQYKPAEMVVIPGGAHALSTPSERMISLQGSVDWYQFWLKGGRRSAPAWSGESVASLRAQYEAWEQMAALKAADDARPRCRRSLEAP